MSGMDSLDTEMMKQQSAFMELQQPSGLSHSGLSAHSMGTHPAYQIRSQYPGAPQHHGQGHDSVFSGAQHRGGLGYPFMNGMSGSYSTPTSHPFSVSPYQTPSPPRDGESFLQNIYFVF